MTDLVPPFHAGWRPQQVAGAETALLPGEAVVFHPLAHALHRIEATAAAVWLWCDGTAQPAEIAADLTPEFGGDGRQAAAAVEQALQHLAAHGLLRGSIPPELLHLVAADEALAADGGRIVTATSGYLDDERGIDQRDDSDEFPCRLVVRLGQPRDRLVVIATDSPAALDRMRRLLHQWLDDSVAAELADAPPAFHVRLSPRRAGRRTELPSLRHGSAHVAQSRTESPIVHALCSLLAGIHGLGRESLPSVGLRAFVRGERLAFVDVPSPLLIADRALLGHGIEELACWQLHLLPNGLVGIAPALAPLHWDAAGFTEPPPARATWRPVGMVTIRKQSMSRGALLAHFAHHCSDVAWFRMVAAAVANESAQDAADRTACRAHLHSVLTIP